MASFSIGDGIGARASLTITNSGMSLFLGVGVGAGASLTFRGGVEAALETSSMTGFRTYAGVEAGAVVSGGIDFSGGSDGLDVTASSGVGDGLSADAGFGFNFTLMKDNPFVTCGP